MKCMVCKVTGANMRKCKKCGQVYCVECALKGSPPYPKISARNVCPMCGSYAGSETAK